MNCRPLCSIVHGVSQARTMEWVAISFSRGSFWPRDWTHISRIDRFFTTEPPGKPFFQVYCSVAKSCLTLCDPVDCSCQASLSFTIFLSLLKLISVELIMPSNLLILCHPFLLLPSIFSSIRVFFQWVHSSHQVAKILKLSFIISHFNEYSGLTSFRIDCFDLLAVQETLKSLLQQHNLNASVLLYGSTLTPYMTTEKP